jgi:CheY-like chemotaxis protein/nitrogen-specific signal transduction histidine kinase
MAAVAVVLVCGALNVYLAEKTDKARLAALDKALSASRAKGSFLSNMSHEMRTPMNAIIGMTQLAKAAESGDRKDYCLGRIEEASTHLLGVINDVLDMSKIEAGKLELSPVHFKFSDILEKVKTINDYRMEQKHQTFEMDIDENIPPELIGDDQRLNQIIMNLMSNAVKLTPEGGVVRLKAALESLNGDEARLTFSVKDSGIGISEEQKARLFNSFEQADSSTSRRYGGTGLGLAISQKIVELMDGEIRVESEPGKGAEFIFTVSLTADSVTPEEAETSGDGGDVSFAGLKILLAEDLDINREIAGALIEPAGAEVFFAADGSEAVDMFAADPAKYDLIFMDVQMPEMDGYEATRAIRALSFPQAKTVPIIAMTANVFKEDIDKCLECGMNGHVGKPLDSKDVYEKIAKHCG